MKAWMIDLSRDLSMEKEIKSVAIVTRRDVEEFIRLAASTPFKPEVEAYPFESLNTAIPDMKYGRIRGSRVLQLP